MIKELLQGKEEFCVRQEVEKEKEKVKKRGEFWWGMEHPELSLGPSRVVVNGRRSDSSTSESETSYTSRKRKYFWDHYKTEPMIHTSVELQLDDPLPLDWEQCLDLESGRMYYLNKNTLRRSWNYPNSQKLDLDLNISTLSSSEGRSSSEMFESSKKHKSSSSSMVAVACLKCHLLVILCRSSPSCPNCKYVHSLPTQQSQPPKVATIKSLDTLSLLH